MVCRLSQWLVLCFTIAGCGVLPAQDIDLYNPSWEGYAHQGTDKSAIIGWNDCGFKDETPPDIHQSSFFGSFFDVAQTAVNGKTFLGMVVRENDTWESVSQRLPTPLIGGRCYSFELSICKSSIYNSAIVEDEKALKRSFTKPAVLRIYGSNSKCGRSELLAKTEPIKNTEWEVYEFKFEPKVSYRYLVIEAFYKTPVLLPYNGNVLLDNASAIRMIDCDDNSLIAAVEPEQDPEIKINTKPEKKPTDKPEAKKPTNKPGPQPKAETHEHFKENPKTDIDDSIIPDLDNNVEVNQVIKIENLYFDENLAKIKEVSYQALDEVYDFLNKNSRVTVEVSGHTNGLCAKDYCDKLSRRRARSVWLYLVHKGIPPQRIKYKGYGKQKPVAENATPKGRQKNQRVEIKILSIDS